MKVLVLNDYADLGHSYYRPFTELGERCNDVSILDTAPETVKCVVFTGGADVNPIFYGQKPSKYSFYQTKRDEFEKLAFDKALKNNIPMFGICRGSQFLCVMAGGKLCQHLSNHGGYHTMETRKGGKVEVNSTHHQMQLPPDDAEVIGWASPKLSDVYLGELDEPITPDKEYEVVYYPKIRALGAQYHPEAMSKTSEGWTYYQKLISQFS